MPFNRLAIPFGVLLAISVYLTFMVDTGWAICIVACVVVLLSGYILSPAINWWWWQRFPPDLPKQLGALLLQKHEFYQKLDEKGRREFRRRIFLFNQGTNFMPKNLERISEDAKMMIAIAPVTMSFNQEQFLFENFENIIVYPHPFPSPQFPEHFHASEIYEEDGVVMLCLEHIIRGFIENDKYFNLTWYEYAKVYQISYPEQNYGDWKTINWAQLEQVCGFSKESLERFIGLPDLDLQAFGIACYFLYPDRFEKYMPKLHTQLGRVFE